MVVGGEDNISNIISDMQLWIMNSNRELQTWKKVCLEIACTITKEFLIEIYQM